MALSGLYDIGDKGRTTNPLVSAKRSKRGQGRGLVVEIGDGIEKEKEGERDDDEEGGEAARQLGGHPSEADQHTANANINNISSSNSPRCLICRQQRARYNCPSCNIPYCSLTCYRAESHAGCSQTFVQKTVRDELMTGERDATEGEAGGGEGQKERIAMMDVLRRMDKMGGAEEEIASDDEEEPIVEGELEHKNLPDLDEATEAQLLAMLSPEERSRFLAVVQDKHPNKDRARALLDKLWRPDQAATLQKPWWEEGSQTYMPKDDHDFLESVDALVKASTPVSAKKPAALQYNLLAVLLVYAYLVRYSDRPSLSGLKRSRSEDRVEEAFHDMPALEPVLESHSGEAIEIDDESTHELPHDLDESETKRMVSTKLRTLLPFLSPSGEESRRLLQSASEAGLYLLARLQDDSIVESASFLVFLYKDVLALLTAPSIAVVDASAIDKTLLALSDIHGHLSKASQKKLYFYGAYWQRMSGQDRKALCEELLLETEHLQAELKQIEDAERQLAARRAVEQAATDPIKTS